MAEVERHEMPNGAVVYYRDSDHQYNTDPNFKRSCRVPGASTISKQDGDGNLDPLLNWAARLTYEGVAREAALGLSLDDGDDIRQALGWLESASAIEQTLQASKLTWREIRNEKGDVGTVSHNVLQALCEGATPLLRTGFDHAVVDWWKKRKPEPLNVEQVVYSRRHGFAGRFDLRAKLERDIALIDLKTSGYIANSYHIQLALYEIACQESGIGGAFRHVILQVREDGSWHEWEGLADRGDALASLDLYKRGKKLSAGARKQHRELKQAQKEAA